jgi:hypothetical protein
MNIRARIVDHEAVARRLAEAGLFVFPVNTATKKPAGGLKWKDVSTNSAADLERLWRAHPAAGVAIDLGKSGYVVIDADRHGGPDGVQALAKLAAQNGGIPAGAPLVATAAGGEHIYFRNVDDDPLGNKRGSLPEAIDVRGKGGYVIAPGTVRENGKGWRRGLGSPDLVEASLAGAIPTVPDWLATIIRTPKSKAGKPSQETAGRKPDPSRSGREQAYADAALKAECDAVAATRSGGRNERLNKAAISLGHLVGAGWIKRGDVEAALFAASVSNGYVADKGERATEATIQSGLGAGECEPSAPLEDRTRTTAPRRKKLDAAAMEEAEEAISEAVRELNQQVAFALEAGKAIVLRQREIDGRRTVERITPVDFERAYQNRKVDTPDGGESSLGKVWLEHPDRRQYLGGVVFDPSGRARDDCLNLWQGFAIQPAAGSWKHMRHPIREIICNGNVEHFEYLLNWMARLFQRPGEQGEVAVVMKSIEGTGKGFWARAIMRIFGQHGLSISNAKHLTGNFNAHLRDCIFLFADEAFFAGDKAHVGVLKSIITEPTLTVEAKYRNAETSPNFLHVVMASNCDWVVPAGLEARRFFCVDVSESRVGDRQYFEALSAELENGGHAAMLHDLLARDIRDFRVTAIPHSDALEQQKKLSLDPEFNWWIDVLTRGFVYQSKLGLEKYFCRWMDEVATELLFKSYLAFPAVARDHRQMGREMFGRFMLRVGAKAIRPRAPMIRGEHIVDCDTAFGTSRKAKPDMSEVRPYAYRLGALHAARENFEAFANFKVEWPAIDCDDDETNDPELLISATSDEEVEF